MTVRHRVLMAAVAATAALSLAGCTGAPDGGPTRTATATPVRTGDVVAEITVAPGTEKGFVGALKDVAVTRCDATEAPAEYGGTVTNPTKDAQSYRIYVSLLVGAKTIGIDQVDVRDVPAHKTKNWSGRIDAGHADARCVLRVERTAVG